MTTARRELLTAAVVAGLLCLIVSALGISIRAADQGAAAVDEPQYLLTATSLWEDRDLDISNQRAQGTAREFYDAALPVQTAVLPGGERISPHDPLLPLLLAPAVGVGGYVGAKVMMALMAGLLGAATTWAIGSRCEVSPLLAGAVVAVAGPSAPLAIYGNQVYPELPAALVVVIAVGAILRPRGHVETSRSSIVRAIVLVLAVTALPWLAIKYVLVAATVAAVGLWRMRSTTPRLLLPVIATFAVSGAIWLASHQILYGGWTAYSTGDHFQGSGEFGAVGFAPDYVGRSVRLIGLLTDRDYGLIAWAPAWLLALPAIGFLLGVRRPPQARSTLPATSGSATPQHVSVVSLPLLAGWLTATFVALTMHGFWSPGRQVVVVLPLAAMLIAVALSQVGAHARASRHRATPFFVGSGAIAAVGVAIMGWVLLAGHQGTLTWVGAPNLTPPAPISALRSILPDYRELGTGAWVLHGLWVVAAILMCVGSWLAGRRLCAPDPSTDDPNSDVSHSDVSRTDVSHTGMRELTS